MRSFISFSLHKIQLGWSSQKDRRSGIHSMYGNMNTAFWLKNLKGKDCFEDLSMNE